MSMDLEILVPDGVVVKTRIRGLQAADASGRFGIWPGHEAFLTLLVPCVVFYRDADGSDRYAAADGGVLLVEQDHVSLVTREAVVADRLELVADKAAAMLEERRHLEKTAQAEFAELQTSLVRELGKVEGDL
jgi:F-type H+-transporting ATPase subunit epsilon